MGEGISPATGNQPLGWLRIAELHLPTTARQGKGSKAAGGPSPEHAGPQRGSAGGC